MKMQLGLKTEIFFCRNDHLQMVILAKIISVSFVGGFISVCTSIKSIQCFCFSSFVEDVMLLSVVVR